jgi:hypothetical protein
MDECSWCGFQIFSTEERVVWNNDKVVCKECDSDCDESDKN